MRIVILISFLLYLGSSTIAQGIRTRWKPDDKPAYPRPQMERKQWLPLDGWWSYAITAKNTSTPTTFDGKIRVPYPVESALSGVQKMLQPDQLLWYKRSIDKPRVKNGERILLHFGAVDFDATVYMNSTEIGNHRGGYQSFSFDITDKWKSGNNELVVKVWDPTDRGPNPHGKQILRPGGIMYTPSSGIWQTVWMEVVPASYLASIKILPDIDKAELYFTPEIGGNTEGCAIEVVATAAGKAVGKASGSSGTSITVPVPKPRLWSPDDPFLYDLEITVKKNGKPIDIVKSYFGMRKVEIKKDDKGYDRIYLNNRYVYNLGTLDQGFWPDGLYTAPSDAALKFDIEAAKAMGFNTIRKHIKIEPARWYYYTDKLGMLVWQDMVNPGIDSPEARLQFEQECKDNVAQLFNYPSIITWVLFNEGWGAYDQARLTKWIKNMDPNRLVNGHSGSLIVGGRVHDPQAVMDKSVHSDMTDVHSYPPPSMSVQMDGKAMVCGEFGGIAVSVEGHRWDDLVPGFGYGNIVLPPQMQRNLSIMIDSLKVFEERGLSGSIYTQPFDVEGEQNGLITYDREVIKLPVQTIRALHARLWPVTTNYAEVTKSFSVRIADTDTVAYDVRLKEYKSGRRDSAFLRTIAVMADEKQAPEIASEYLKSVKNPFLPENLKFIRKFTKSSADVGFKIVSSNRPLAEATLGKAAVSEFFRDVVGAEIHAVIFAKDQKPDFQQLEADVVHKYGIDGEEVFWTKQALYYYFEKDYDNFITVKRKIHAKYPNAISTFDMNNDAWLLFENISDKDKLETALSWSKKVIEKEPTANYYDTYANILYKLGRKDEAIAMQEKGLTLEAGNGFIEDVKKNLEKMKAGKPTWPN